MRRVYIYHYSMYYSGFGSPSLLLTIDPSVKPSKKAHISRSSVNQKVGLLHKQLVQKMHRERKKSTKAERGHRLVVIFVAASSLSLLLTRIFHCVS